MIELLIWAVTITLGSAVGVAGWFFAYAHAKHLKEEGIRFNAIMKIPLHIYLYAGVLFDVVFNLTVGSIVFREVPKEWLFTTRVQRHVTADSWRQATAKVWAQRLNKVDPGHVKV
jgi:hypothetical protein